jgi:hypothetical protein
VVVQSGVDNKLKVCNPIGLENKIEGSQKPRCKVGRSHRRQLLKEAKSMNVVDALLSVACPPPVIPVKVYQDADANGRRNLCGSGMTQALTATFCKAGGSSGLLRSQEFRLSKLVGLQST